MNKLPHDNHLITFFSQVLEACRANEPGHLVVITDTHIDYPLMDGTMCLALSQIAKEPDTPCYSDIIHLRMSTQATRKLPSTVQRRACEAATLESVISALEEVPEGSAIFMRQIDEIWVGRDDSPASITAKSWTGEIARVQSLEQRAAFTLSRVIPALSELAKSRNLLVVSVCNLPGKVLEILPEHIRQTDNLSYITGKDDTTYSKVQDALMAGVAEFKNGTKTIEELKTELERVAPDEVSRRQACAQALSCAGLHHAAWEELAPILPKMESFPATMLVRTAKMALDALDAKSCQYWIALALERGIAALQDWMVVLQMARTIGNEVQEFQLLEKMSIHFPDNEVVLLGKLRSMIAEGDIAGAGIVAGRLGRPGAAAAIKVITRGGSIPEVLKCTANDEDRGLALMIMSVVGERKRNYSLAWEAARRVPAGTPQHTYVLGLRWRIWAKRTMEREEDQSAPGRPNHKDVARLNELVSDTLVLSRDVSIRHAMEDACHETLTPTIFQDASVMLLTTELRLLRDEAEDKPWHYVIAAEGVQAETTQCSAFFSALSQPGPIKHTTLGQGELPAEAQGQATPEMARYLIHTLQMAHSHEADEVTRLTLLQLVEMICRYLAEPSLDITAGLILVRATALGGDGQSARNYAEEILRTLPDTQPDYSRWRLGLAWMVIAESLLASGSARGALLPMILAVRALRDNVVDSMKVAEALNIGARMLRDLQEIQKAKELIEMERELLKKHAQDFLLQRNRHFGFILQLKVLSPSKPDGVTAFMQEVLKELRMMESTDDRMPLLALVANCIRFLRMAKQEVNNSLITELIQILDECEKNGPSRSAAVRLLILGRFTVEWFIDQLTKASRAVRSEDADAQFGTIQIVAVDGFEQAVDDNDPSLALAAAAALTQPALLCRQSSKATEADRAARLFRAQLASGLMNLDESGIKDHLAALADRGNPRLLDLDWTHASSVERVQQLLAPTEMLIVTCILCDHSLGILKIFKDEVSQVTAVQADLWKEKAWLNAFPRISRLLTREDLNQTLRDIRQSPWVQVPPEITHVVIVPETRLFGWPLGASLASSGITGERLLGLSVMPSIAILAQSRQIERVSLGGRVFWVGRGIQDAALLAANREVPTLASSNGLTQIHKLDRENVGKASLALLVTHGEMTASGELAGLSDETHSWNPEDVGNILAGCECVVLGCCSAGTSEIAATSNESWGLTSSILSHGVKCVIAPVWPISVGFLVRWLSEFLPTSAAGVNVADAVAFANVRTSNDDQERFSMQAYGDGALCLEHDKDTR